MDSDSPAASPVRSWAPALTGVCVTALLMAFAATGTGTALLDRPTLDAAVAARAPWSDAVVTVFSALGGTIANWVMTTIAVLVLLFLHRRREAAFVLLVSAGAGTVMRIVKESLARPRPPEVTRVIDPPGWSLPSGHATMAAALTLTVWTLVAPWLSRRWRWLLAAGLTLWAVAMAASRVYLGVHWFSDVVAGLALGVTWWLISSGALGGRILPPSAPLRGVQR